MEALPQAQDHGRDDNPPTLPFSLNSNALALRRSFYQRFPFPMVPHPHAPVDILAADILGGTIAVRVPLAMLGPAVPFSAQLRCFLSHKPPPSSAGPASLPSTWRLSLTSLLPSAPATLPASPAENFTTVFECVVKHREDPPTEQVQWAQSVIFRVGSYSPA